jgi:hypothetical protein
MYPRADFPRMSALQQDRANLLISLNFAGLSYWLDRWHDGSDGSIERDGQRSWGGPGPLGVVALFVYTSLHRSGKMLPLTYSLHRRCNKINNIVNTSAVSDISIIIPLTPLQTT